MKKVVTVGGGTGSFTVLTGLKKFEDVAITALVSMADDGGSTGVLRDELGVLPGGRCEAVPRRAFRRKRCREKTHELSFSRWLPRWAFFW